ncbi:2-keto-3-deoxy-L-rhamnonate aldolase [Thioclava sp. SK-1]|uniref:aldolase/citrate lyase family protein n=1 Tax=Thioclava sp. SK-1 TaxID=1889770 RepID=UPI000826A7CF|nr:HpcH/HpaI aldolase/citrate lyase family protein [Thioclava sp. SK-1]OCX64479.1 2-keto-3-deoxy-L-rhamnonate aldolase [Thioclava sp. SK-1]
MPAPENPFKAALANGQLQIGLWQDLASPYCTELCADAGYDWLLIDAEHGPNDLVTISGQIAATRGSGAHPIVRPAMGAPWMIKQLMDAGAQTILVPMVETAQDAQALVRAMRYPPHGIRGVGAVVGRASGFGRIADYVPTADAQACLLVQVETVRGLENLDEIATTQGVDGVFIGPADLAASLGHLDNPAHPQVQRVIEDIIARVIGHGKAAGILIGDLALSKRYAQLGATFVAIGHDVGLLALGASKLLADFHAVAPAHATAQTKVY